MTEDFIERYDNLNTKGCPEDLIFGDFNNQLIPCTYLDIKHDYDDNRTQIDAALADKKLVGGEVVPNYENKNDDSLTSNIDPPLKLNYGNWRSGKNGKWN